jgi:acyl carrier protein
MPLSKEKIIQTIFDAVDELNTILTEEERLEKSPETLLAGEKGSLDSLGLINFIVEVESRVQKDLGLALNLIEALDSPEEPMRSISRLVEFIEVQANGKNQ